MTKIIFAHNKPQLISKEQWSFFLSLCSFKNKLEKKLEPRRHFYSFKIKTKARSKIRSWNITKWINSLLLAARIVMSYGRLWLHSSLSLFYFPNKHQKLVCLYLAHLRKSSKKRRNFYYQRLLPFHLILNLMP